MRLEALLFSAVLSSTLPIVAEAQHSHGGSAGMDHGQSHERQAKPSPKLPPGLLPVGSTREIEVLVMTYGFSPADIRADVGETVTLLVRREDPICASGLEIPSKKIDVDLPLGKAVPVTLELKRAERIELRCKDDRSAAVLVVGSP